MAIGLLDLWFPGETARGEELSRRNEELNRRKVEAGQMTPQEADAQQTRFDSGTDYNAQIYNDAVEGATEGLKTIPDSIRNGLNGVAGWTWRAIPWWVFLGAIVYLLIWMGGLEKLKGILVKK